MQDEPRQIDTLLAQHEFLFLKRVLRGRLQCAKNIVYSRYIIRLNALRNIWISRWLVFCQFGCYDAVGFKTGFVMAGGLVVIDWSVAIVSFITDLVIAGAESLQRAIKRIFVAKLYKAILVFTDFYIDLFTVQEFVGTALEDNDRNGGDHRQYNNYGLSGRGFHKPPGLTHWPRVYKHKISQATWTGPIHSIDFARNADSISPLEGTLLAEAKPDIANGFAAKALF